VATRTYSAKIGAGGTGTVTIKTGTREVWIISQVTIELVGAPSGATADIRLNDYLVTLMVAQGDTAANDPPVTLLATDAVTVNWYGCTVNQIGKVMIFYEVRTNLQ
jgi:hypothetical protein